MRTSPALNLVARNRAEEIDRAAALDFEPLSGDDLLHRLQSQGYSAWFAQELDAIEPGDSCDVLERWEERLADGEGLLRHEVQEVGIGLGVLGESPLYVLILAVPASEDAVRKRWPGVAPREWLTAQLRRKVNERRMSEGLPSLDGSLALDAIAQTLSNEILRDPKRSGAGRALTPSGEVAVYYKGEALHVRDPGMAIRSWFEQFRDAVTQRGALPAGVGLASRGRGDRLEAVWVLVVWPGSS